MKKITLTLIIIGLQIVNQSFAQTTEVVINDTTPIDSIKKKKEIELLELKMKEAAKFNCILEKKKNENKPDEEEKKKILDERNKAMKRMEKEKLKKEKQTNANYR